MKTLLLLSILLCVFKVVIAQSVENKQFTGVILKKTWTKTTQSYCAGGSDYYVLQSDTEEFVLDRGGEKANDRYFKKWIGKKVVLKANMVEKKIKNDNPAVQKPVTFSPDGKQTDGEFSCWVLKVISIQKM